MHVPDQEEALEEKAAHMEKAVIPQDVAEEAETTVEEVEESEASGSSSKPLLTSASATGPVQRSGRWTPDEKILFLYGLKRFGKGRWKKMSIYLPHRSLVQIKSHAQKVLKRLEAGENVFRRLEENYSVVDSLIVQAAKQRDALGGPIDTKYISTVAKRKRQPKKSSSPTVESINQEDGTTTADASQQSLASADPDSSDSNTESGDGGRGAVIAAAALCQLSSLGATWDQQQQQQAGSSLQKAN